jgi:hypothetical protein
MDFTKELIEIVSTFPTSISTKDAEEVGEYLLPFSVGIEFECDKQDHYNLDAFKSIPYILDVNVDSCEQRYRIPKGLKGLQCLYRLSLLLKENSVLNLGSGIHYHVDFTECFSKITAEFINTEKEYILTELDKWEYKGKYNSRNVVINNRCWVQVSSEFKTFEFRIGEMTFDYDLLFKRISHLMEITKKVKYNLNLYHLNIDRTSISNDRNKEKEIIKKRKINIYDNI